ncbi:dienelactone hydrolase family protein [Alterisphingorhabdus coralli]|uniref:Dienelactone hydrolase family protein n=1 Tax=Alterisphingorhabdus coralli TaxID=3071408 RepID=A0AA97F5X5_9SPHN|nr:dienelactone hydrolase family protein [Parasphingorhabdus sp. SCSIO 66989]WOE74934.1 dienelactone hydrolase family protein [Parasphingorhabdus sp. SCSIO 66989]
MCDETDFAEWDRAGLTRRSFTVMGGAAVLMACTGMSKSEAEESGLVEQDVAITMADGTNDAFFVHPGSGKHPAVILWPDIASLREVKKMMARRLAAEGYAVLVTNPFYRDTPAPQFADFSAFRSEGGFEKVGPWRRKLSAETIGSDAKALVQWLDGQEAVDTNRGIGNQGYCMGGPFTVWSAAAVPDRIKAAASFHGGGLVREGNATSPHALIGETQASFLFAIAQNDDAKQPEAMTVLAQVAEEAQRPAEIEVYAADHGWTVPDSPVYDQDEAERVWSALLKLYSAAL